MNKIKNIISQCLFIALTAMLSVSCSSDPDLEPDPNGDSSNPGGIQKDEFAPDNVAGKEFRFYGINDGEYDLKYRVIAATDPMKAKIYVEPVEYTVIGSPSFYYEKTDKNTADVSCMFHYDLLGIIGFAQIFYYDLELTFKSPNYGTYEGQLTHFESTDDWITVKGAFVYDSYKSIEELANEIKDNDSPNSPDDPEIPGNSSAFEDFDIFSTLEKDEMIAVEGGTFTMGATAEQGSYYYDDELPTHQVTLSDFYIGKYEVTQQLWEYVMKYSGKAADGSTMSAYADVWLGKNPLSTYGVGNYYPAYYVSWEDIVNIFIPRLNKITGKNFRLPTEAEWEFAARGGNSSKGYKYSGSNTIGNVAWYYDNSSSKTHQVGTKSPNELGIYDMSGNVWEWCSDWYGSYSSTSQTNPTGPTSGSYRVLRGGSWDGSATHCRVSFRHCSAPGGRAGSYGFRLCSSRL